MLQVQDISFDFPEKQVLHKVNFNLPSGNLVHVRGQNGVGKTTLLKIIAGLLTPTEGQIKFEQEDISKNTLSYQSKIAYLGHKLGISQLLTVAENCRYALHAFPSPLSISHILKQVGLAGLEHIPCHLLSAGQKKRVALMQLLLRDTRLWILDEPLVSLDEHAISLLKEIMSAHLSKGGAIVMSSHQSLLMPQANIQEYSL